MEKSVRRNTNFIYLLRGLLISYIITAFVLVILSFLMLKLDISSAIISGGIIFSYIISTFVGGFLVGTGVEQRRFLWGMILGVFYFIIIMLLSIIINQATSLPMGNLFTVLIICSLSGMLGGMIS